MISESDGILIERFKHSGDAEAFAALAQRYAPMVYATALRVTGNASDAEDVSQDCFLALARQASVIRSSVAAWLHRQAVGRAVDRVRKASRQVKRERLAMSINGGTKSEATWQEIAPYVDQALLQLPDDLREPIILHYLQGLTQEQVAEKCEISQPTVHRRLEKGVTALRASMRKAGFVVSAAVLASFLSGGTAHAAPAGLIAVLGKLAISGIGGPGGAGAAAAATGTAITAGGIGMKIAAAVVIGTTVIGAAAYSLAGPAKEPVPEPAPAIMETVPAAADTPPPVQEQPEDELYAQTNAMIHEVIAAGFRAKRGNRTWSEEALNGLVQDIMKCATDRGMRLSAEQARTIAQGVPRLPHYIVIEADNHPTMPKLAREDILYSVRNYLEYGKRDPHAREVYMAQVQALVSEWATELRRLYPDKEKDINEAEQMTLQDLKQRSDNLLLAEGKKEVDERYITAARHRWEQRELPNFQEIIRNLLSPDMAPHAIESCFFRPLGNIRTEGSVGSMLPVPKSYEAALQEYKQNIKDISEWYRERAQREIAAWRAAIEEENKH